MNRAILSGVVKSDPITFGEGTSQNARFTVVTSVSWKANGKSGVRTDYHNVVVWGSRAADIMSLVKEGDTVIVDGELRNSSYTDTKTDTKKWKTEVVITQGNGSVELLGTGTSAEDTVAEAEDFKL